eukprot:3848876-Rhodomonas_salina.3
MLGALSGRGTAASAAESARVSVMRSHIIRVRGCGTRCRAWILRRATSSVRSSSSLPGSTGLPVSTTRVVA